MISSIEITRFRGIREGKLEDLTPLVVLVGPNGCGKTSVLDALLLAGSRSVKDGIVRALQRHEGVQYGARWLFWRTGIHGPCEISITSKGRAERNCKLMPVRPDSWEPFPVRCEIRETTGARSGGLILEFSRGNRVDAVAGTEPDTPPEVFPGARLIETRREDPAIPLHRVVTKTAEDGMLKQVLGIMGELVPGVQDVRILTEADLPIVQFYYGDRSIPAALAGDGIYSLFRLSVELASQANGTVLLEEPEVHQHPGAIRQSMRAILAAVRRDAQVILTTHSLELIDLLLAEATEEDLEKLSLYRLELQDGLLISHRIPGSEVEFSRIQVEKDLR